MKIEIYTKTACVYCTRAKDFLKSRDIVFSEYKLDQDFTTKTIHENFPSAKTFPVIVIEGKYIGGYEELVLLHDDF